MYGMDLAVPYKTTAMRALATEVLVVTKKFAGNHWKTVPQGLKSPAPNRAKMAR
jgi:hypothetical protein